MPLRLQRPNLALRQRHQHQHQIPEAMHLRRQDVVKFVVDFPLLVPTATTRGAPQHRRGRRVWLGNPPPPTPTPTPTPTPAACVVAVADDPRRERGGA